ncbi:MAG TPA: caspase family protein [Steroidobacteraceae bacterium]
MKNKSNRSVGKHVLCALYCAALAGGGLTLAAPPIPGGAAADINANRFVVVDCLLPGQVRKLGGQMTYLSPRTPTKSTGSECEIRGGEYVAYDRANFATSLQVWMPKAKEGDPQAETYVGEIFEKGMGQPADPAKAAEWYQKAADKGYAQAQTNLAYLYEKGIGVPADPVKALNLYRQAAGISTDQLTFASEVTKVQTQAQSQLDAMAAQLERATGEADSLRAQLLDSENRVEKRRMALAAARRDANDLRQKLAAAKQGDPAESADRLAHLKQLERDLKDREGRIAEQQSEVNDLEKTAAQDKAQLEAKIAAAGAQDAALRKELGDKNTDAATLRGQLAAAQERVAATNQRVDELTAQLNAERGNIKREHDRLAQDLAGAGAGKQADNERTRQALAEREAQISQQSALIASLQSQKKSYDEQFAQLKSQKTADASSVRGQLASAQDQQSATNRRVEELTAQLNAERDAIKKEHERMAQDSKGALAGKQAENDRMRQALADREAQLSQQSGVIAALQSQRKNYDDQIASLKAQEAKEAQQSKQQAADLQNARAELASTQQRFLQTQQRLSDAESKFNRDRAQIAAEREQMAKARASVAADQMKEVQRLAQEVGSREKQLIEQRAQIAALQAESKEYTAQIDRLKPAAALAMRSGHDETEPPLSPPHAFATLPKGVIVGNYHALIIGNNSYQYMPNLETAVNDARAVDKVLKEHYGFKTRVLENATRAQLLSALNDYRMSLKDSDNLLIYYAGHGELDEKNQRGYWLPVNARREDNTEWVSDQMITDQIALMAARHVLVVADSCYSGSMTRSSGLRLVSKGTDDAEVKRITALSKLPSRTVLTSGGEKPVLDGGGGANSIFARALLDILTRNDGILEGSALWNQIFDPVKHAAAQFKVDQSPRYSVLPDAGHMNGEFLFVPRAS